MESIIANAYKSQEEPKVLSKSEIDNEITYLESLINTNDDIQRTLYIIEHLASVTNDYKLVSISIQHIKKPLKYAIYNLRILKALQNIQEEHKIYIPLANEIINILKDIKIENNDKMYFDWDKLRVGGNAIHSQKFCEFVFENCIKILYKNINLISNSIGFPEVIYWIEKEVKKLSFEGFCKKVCDNFINQIEKQKKYVIDERKKLKPSMYNVKEVKKLESLLNKLEN